MGLFLHRPVKRLLRQNSGVDLSDIVFGEILVIQPFQLLRHIHVTVQIDIAVGRMVISLMKIQELFVRQIRNKRGISARFLPIAVVREQNLSRITVQDLLRGGECSLHLIIDDAVID